MPEIQDPVGNLNLPPSDELISKLDKHTIDVLRQIFERRKNNGTEANNAGKRGKIFARPPPPAETIEASEPSETPIPQVENTKPLKTLDELDAEYEDPPPTVIFCDVNTGDSMVIENVKRLRRNFPNFICKFSTSKLR